MGDSPHVVVIGGGSTGTGLARDLAMRGLAVTLLERSQLTGGATGRMHGLLHSGARYADADPASARDCIAESGTLREIAGHCVEETGGLFVSLSGDDDAYVERKRTACEDCAIPVEELSGAEARDREPGLAPETDRALAVPDATVDPFALTAANARSAQNRGATIRTHTAVTDVLVEDGTVAGVEIASEETPGTTVLDADHVVNATGAWASEIAGMAGIDVPLRLSKGAMAAVSERPTERVVNRCRPRGEGDILVPFGRQCILGTTDREVTDPDDVGEGEDEAKVDFLVEELAHLVPAVADATVCHAYWGVRPLYQSVDGTDETTNVTRDYAVLDHERDGVSGMTTVVGGKLTTYRLMAEEVADRVCATLDAGGSCRTDEAPLPGHDDRAVLSEAMAEFDLEPARRSLDQFGSV